jgi:outer membrane protein TolC
VGPRPFVSSLVLQPAGPNFFAGLSVQLPLQNREARGALSQQEAQLRQLELTSAGLARTIRSNVGAAAGELRRSLEQRQRAREAVAGFAAAKDNELKRLRSNMATNADVLLVDARLTSAQLTLLRAETQVAQEVVRLRFESGTLLAMTGEGEEITLRRLLSPPDLREERAGR